MRLTLVISSLGCGGAERVMTRMANYWAAQDREVTLLTFEDETAAPFYQLDDRVWRVSLGVAADSVSAVSAVCNNLRRIYKLRQAIRASDPDVVISFIDRTNVTALLATRGLGTRVIVSERIDPANQAIGTSWQWLRRWTYPMADAVVVQTKAAAAYFTGLTRSRIRIIPNPVGPAPTPAAEKERNFPVIVSIGRLDPQKGLDLLITAFAQLKEKHSNWRLVIFGEGPKRNELETLRDSLGLSDRIFLPGRVADVYEAFSGASLFVMSSRYEGFPNALCEAMACGLPVISTDCPHGPREIINDDVDGILVRNGDIDSLTAAMDDLMADDLKRSQLGACARRVTERFSITKIMMMWEEAITDLVRDRSYHPAQARSLTR